jgi:hypothetical protein
VIECQLLKGLLARNKPTKPTYRLDHYWSRLTVLKELSLHIAVKSLAILALAHFWCRLSLYFGGESSTEMTHQGVINLGRTTRARANQLNRHRGFDGSRSDNDTGEPKRRSCCCPICRQRSRRVHSHYNRRLADLPPQGRAVIIVIAARRFRCGNVHCERRIFVEQLPNFVAAHARRSRRLADNSDTLAWRWGAPQALAWRIALPCQRAATHCSDWSGGTRRLPQYQRQPLSALTTSPGSGGSATAPWSEISNAAASLTSYPTASRLPSRHGWSATPGSPLWRVIAALVTGML